MRYFLLDLLIFAAFFLAASELALLPLPVWEGLGAQPLDGDHPYPEYEANSKRRFSIGWNFQRSRLTSVNNVGQVNEQDYSTGLSTPLMAVIGDSFVEARMLAFPKTLQGILSDAADGAGRVYSFGCANTALGTYLKLAELALERFGARSLVFVVVEDDILRALASYKRSPRGYYFFPAKKEDEVELRRVDFQKGLLSKVAQRSSLLRYLLVNVKLLPVVRAAISPRPPPLHAPEEELRLRADKWRRDGERATRAFLDELARVIAGRDVRVAILLDGRRAKAYDGRLPVGRPRRRELEFEATRAGFGRLVEGRGYELLDLEGRQVNFVKTYGKRIDFVDDHHWNADGHRIAAEAVIHSEAFRETFRTDAAGRVERKAKR